MHTPNTPAAQPSTEKRHLIESILLLEMPLQLGLESMEHSLKAANLNRGSEHTPSTATAQVRARRQHLEAHTLDALKTHHAAVIAKRAQHEEAARFYNKPDARVDYRLWLAMDFWTLDEAVAILCQRDPRVVNKATIERDLAPKKGFLPSAPKPSTSFTKAFLELSHLAERSIAMTHSPRLTPAEVIRWAKGAIDQSVPAPLLAYLERQSTLLPPAEPEPEPLAPAPATATPDELRKTKVKRAVLLDMSDRWRTVASDFQHAKENGLDEAAKAPERSMWWQEAALDWAARHGKLRQEPSSAPLRSSVFRMGS